MNTEKRIFTIVGPHAGQTENSIFDRKIKDIEKVGETFWVIKKISYKSLEEVQGFCENGKVKIYFISPSIKGAAKDTKNTSENNEYSKDGECWEKIPEEISKVTGSGYAFILSKLDLKTDEKINIYDYAEESHEPVEFSNRNSTICVIKKDTSNHPKRMHKNSSGTKNIRTVWAVGTLKCPYYVKVRNKVRK